MSLAYSCAYSHFSRNSWETHLAFGEAIEAIVDCIHPVAICNADSNSGAHSCIHSSCGCPYIDDSHIAVALKTTGQCQVIRQEQAPICRLIRGVILCHVWQEVTMLWLRSQWGGDDKLPRIHTKVWGKKRSLSHSEDWAIDGSWLLPLWSCHRAASWQDACMSSGFPQNSLRKTTIYF